MPEPTDTPHALPMRLQKFLARAGVASRRGSEALMTAGRVAVNGRTVTELGAKVDPAADEVTVDGQVVTLAGECVYLMLHKPLGYVTTMSDPQGRPTVAELVPSAEHPGLFPVGRLDRETSGLLLFTTDGEFAHRILHPRWKVPKLYTATVDGRPAPDELDALRDGIDLDDGRTAPAQVEMLELLATAARVSITITEGRKRQVRRMFSAIGHPVIDLHRIAFGPVELSDLTAGAWRQLSPAEAFALLEAVGLSEGERDR